MKNPKLDCKNYESCLKAEKLTVDIFGNEIEFHNCEKCLAYNQIKMKPLTIIPLKRCPFCGGEAVIKKDTTCCGHGDFGPEKWIQCTSCGVRTAKYFCDGYYGCEMTDEEITKKWNRRCPY